MTRRILAIADNGRIRRPTHPRHHGGIPMTEQHDDPTRADAEPGSEPRFDEPLADEPIPDAGPAAEGGTGTTGREWLTQLETMIQDIATQAAPVARQIAAKAAELTAVAAVKAGPFAQRAAEVTTDAGQRLAERAQSLAAELRADPSATEPSTGDATDAGDAAAGMDEATPEATFEAASDDDDAPRKPTV
jgi:hypothetical protein